MVRNLKFCANLSFLFKEIEGVLDRYDAAKFAGFTGVEIGFPYDIPLPDLKKRKEDNGLEQVLINAYPGDLFHGEFGFAGIPGREQDFNNSIQITMDYADALKCKRIHFLAGKLLPGDENQANGCAVLETLTNNLRGILPQLTERGITALIEPINTGTIPGYALCDFDAALSVVKELDSPHLRLQVDIFHLQKIHGNLTQRLEQLLPFTGHIQIAQVPHRNEPHLPGELNYGYIFDLLEKAQYPGWIGLEYHSDPNLFTGGGVGTTVQGLGEWTKMLNCSIK